MGGLPPSQERWIKPLMGFGVAAVAGYIGMQYLRQPAPIVFEPAKASPNRLLTDPKPSSEAPQEVVVDVLGAVRRRGVYRFAPGARVQDAIEAAGGATNEADLDQLNLAAKVQDGSQLVVPSRGARSASLSGQIPPMPLEVTPLVGQTSRKSSRKGSVPPVKRTTPDPRVAEPYRASSSPQYKSDPAAGAVAAAAPPPASSARSGSRSYSKKQLPTEPININLANAAELQRLPGIGPATAAKILEYRKAHGSFRSVDELDNVKGIGPKKLEALRMHVRV